MPEIWWRKFWRVTSSCSGKIKEQTTNTSSRCFHYNTLFNTPKIVQKYEMRKRNAYTFFYRLTTTILQLTLIKNSNGGKSLNKTRWGEKTPHPRRKLTQAHGNCEGKKNLKKSLFRTPALSLNISKHSTNLESSSSTPIPPALAK